MSNPGCDGAYYDNPETDQRELWWNGVVIACITHTVLANPDISETLKRCPFNFQPDVSFHAGQRFGNRQHFQIPIETLQEMALEGSILETTTMMAREILFYRQILETHGIYQLSKLFPVTPDGRAFESTGG